MAKHTLPRVMCLQLPARPVCDIFSRDPQGTELWLASGRDTEVAHDTWLGGTKLIWDSEGMEGI